MCGAQAHFSRAQPCNACSLSDHSKDSCPDSLGQLPWQCEDSFKSYFKFYANRIGTLQPEYRILPINEAEPTTISVPFFILQWKGEQNKTIDEQELGDMPVELQFIKHHKDRYLELCANFAKLEKKPQKQKQSWKTSKHCSLWMFLFCRDAISNDSLIHIPPPAQRPHPTLSLLLKTRPMTRVRLMEKPRDRLQTLPLLFLSQMVWNLRLPLLRHLLLLPLRLRLRNISSSSANPDANDDEPISLAVDTTNFFEWDPNTWGRFNYNAMQLPPDGEHIGAFRCFFAIATIMFYTPAFRKFGKGL